MATTQAEFGLSTIGQIAVPVQDIARATAFYRDVLKLPFLFSAPPGLAFFQCGATWLMLDAPAAREMPGHSSVLYFDVPDVDAAYAALTARSVPFVDQPHVIHRDRGRELWMAFFRDSEGNTHAIRAWRTAG